MVYLDKGYIGCFEMIEKDSGKKQLETYILQLERAGHKQIIAPINGNTWHTYRLVSRTSDEPLFPFEPHNPLWYNEVFEECGFKPLKKYISGRFGIGNIPPLRNNSSTLKLRNFYDGDLEIIYDISLRGFSGNFLYSDITFEEFCRLYQPVLPMLDPDLTIIAEVNNRPVGFIFSFAIGDRLILKSVAILPEFVGSGIGARLINHVLVAGQQKGLKTAIAALMAVDNQSCSIVSKYGSEIIREYTLYVRRS